MAEAMRGVRADPTVRAILDAFPGAEIVAVTTRAEPEAEAASGDGHAADALDEQSYTEDDL